MSNQTQLRVEPASKAARRRWQTPVVITATTALTEKVNISIEDVPTDGAQNFYNGPS